MNFRYYFKGGEEVRSSSKKLKESNDSFIYLVEQCIYTLVYVYYLFIFLKALIIKKERKKKTKIIKQRD